MKALKLIFVAFGFCCLVASVSMADERKNVSGKGQPAKSQYSQARREHKERHEYRGQSGYRERGEYGGRPDYRGYGGYRERPYDRNRHYTRYDYKGRRYSYDGHWRSWDQWERYEREHPDIRKHGRYYRESGHLMFRFCEPGTGNCFFFSIGR
jgi:hypothetical protein